MRRNKNFITSGNEILMTQCQFHQHFTHQYFCAKKLQSQNVTKEQLRKALSYEKLSHKMLVKSTTSCLPACLLLTQTFIFV